MSTVRISELPVVSTLNDDDFIVVNTQNIVTQGIEAENFILSLFGRDLVFTGTATFSKNVIFSDIVTYNENAIYNDTVEFNDAVIFNGITNLELSSLIDVEFTTTPLSGHVLTWSGVTQKWGSEAPTGGGGGSVDLTSFTVTTGAATDGGSLVYDNTSGEFTYRPSTGIPDAPTDGKTYQRRNGSWVEVTAVPSQITFSPTEPSTPVTGQMWLDSSIYRLYVWDGSWIATS